MTDEEFCVLCDRWIKIPDANVVELALTGNKITIRDDNDRGRIHIIARGQARRAAIRKHPPAVRQGAVASAIPSATLPEASSPKPKQVENEEENILDRPKEPMKEKGKMAAPSLKNDLEAQEMRQTQAQFDTDSQRGLENIWREFPEVPRHEAATKFIASYCDPFPINLDGFRMALENPDFCKGLQMQSIKDQKLELIEEIAALLSMKNGGGFDDHALQAEKKNRLQWQSVDELTKRRDSILRERELRKKPLAEIRQIVRDSVPPPGYPKLPRTFVPSGQVQSVPLDSKYLTHLVRNDRETYTRLARIYGVAQLNDRIQGKD